MKRTILAGLLAAACLALPPASGHAQSVATRTPNLEGGWTAAPGVIQINFLHRFSVSDAPLRKLTNTPTFHVGTGLHERVMVGFTWGSNSDLVPRYPNEWEVYARALPFSEEYGDPFDLSVQGGYNVASESVDGELLLARTFGRLRLLAAGRAFSEAYDREEARFAVVGGASIRMTPSISLAGDWGVLLDREDGEKEVWGAGVQMGVPYTPHSFSIHASNVGTASLEGASRGGSTRFGFEYTVPINLRRYISFGGGGSQEEDGTASAAEMMSAEPMMASEMMSAEPMMASADDMAGPPAMAAHDETMAGDEEMSGGMDMMMASGDTVVIEISKLAFAERRVEVAPGTTVRWVNRDPIQHTVMADDGAFDSELVDPGAGFTRTFTEAGTYAYHCVPHPFMKGVVVVTEMMDADTRTAKTTTNPEMDR